MPAEFFKTYGELLERKLHEVLTSALDAAIVMKPGKDPEHSSSYRPILLLNVDPKVLTKVLAFHFNKVILFLIHRDQTRYI